MSGIAGIFRRHSSIETQLLDDMTGAMIHRGPDGRQTWTEEKIGLASCLLKTTPESENESPITRLAGRFFLVWDGRIDNREEILPHLKVSTDAPDADVFLHSYQQWGKECLKRLVGEFAFALWDRQDQMLFAGRDRVGLKPFHYAWDGSNFYFASEIKPLFKALGGMPGFDEEMVLSFLSFRNFKEEDHGRTFFKKIQRLAPSHCLTLKSGVLNIERYASWDLETVFSSKNEEDYLSQFRDIFEKAVRSRLRSRTRVSALLSGGHDSSAIVATAAQSGSAGNLEALNLYSDDPHCDERSYAKEVAEATGIPLHALFGKTRDFMTGLGEFLYRVEAPMINISRNLEPYQFLQERGIRVVLDGEGGDQVLDELGFGADLLSRFRFAEFFQKSESFSAEFGDNPRDFMKESLLQVLPEKWQNLRRAFAGNVPAPWLNAITMRQNNFKSRILRTEHRPAFKSYSQAATYREVTNPYAVMKLELDERAWAQYGIEIRCPFYDSRLIQFMLSLPWQYRASGSRKLILKEAMKGVVPSRISARRDKANATAETDSALRLLLNREQPEAVCNRSGMMDRYADLGAVRELVKKYLAGDKGLRFELWFLITTDYLLQQFTQGASHEGKKEQEEVHHAASY